MVRALELLYAIIFIILWW